jgi:hypothetical protein
MFYLEMVLLEFPWMSSGISPVPIVINEDSETNVVEIQAQEISSRRFKPATMKKVSEMVGEDLGIVPA